MKNKFIIVLTFLFTLLLISCGEEKQRDYPNIDFDLNITINTNENVSLKNMIRVTDVDGETINDYTLASNETEVTIDGHYVKVSTSGYYIIKISAKDPIDPELVTTKEMFIEVVGDTNNGNDEDNYEKTNIYKYEFNKVVEKDLNGFEIFDKEGKLDNEVLKIEKNSLLINVNEYIRVVKSINTDGISELSFELDIDVSEDIEMELKIQNDEDTLYANEVFVEADNDEKIEITYKNDKSLETIEFIIEVKEDVELTFNKLEISYSDERTTNIHEKDLTYENNGDKEEFDYEDNSLTIMIDEFTDEIWKQKIFTNEIDLLASLDYTLIFDILTSKDFTFEYFSEISNIFFDKEEFLIEKNNEITITKKIKAKENSSFMMFLHLAHPNNTDGTEIKISNLKISFKGEVTEMFQFNKTTEVKTFNSGDGTGEYNIDNGLFIYDINSFGENSGDNKIYIQDINFKNEHKYKFKIEIYSDKPLELEFVVNEQGGSWNPYIYQTVELNNELKTYNFEINNVINGDDIVEVLLQFGHNDLETAKVYLKSITIEEFAKIN